MHAGESHRIRAGIAAGLALAAACAHAQQCELDPRARLAPEPPASTECSSPADDVIRAAPRILEGVLRQCVPIAMSRSMAEADATVRAKIVEIQNKVATYCVAFPPQGQLGCQAAVVTGTLSIEAAECVTRGVIDGAPITEANRTLAKAAADVVFDLNSRGTFLGDARKFANGELGDVERGKFVTEISKNWEEALALKFASGVNTFVEFVSDDAVVANAVAEAEQKFEQCDTDAADAALRRAVETGRRGIEAARAARRDSEREMRCIERMFLRQYGPGWRQAVATRGGGAAADDYNRHAAQVERILATESTRLARLDRAGQLCDGTGQMRTLVAQGRAAYEETRLAARAILLGPSCDLATAEQALVVLETMEANPCKGPITNTPAEFVARGTPFASVALRAELPRKQRECAAAATGDASPAQPVAGPGFSIAGTWTGNNGFVYEIAQNGYSFTWTVPNQPGLGERGQGSLTESGQVNASWTNVNGTGNAYGTIFSIDDQRRARRISWSNGIQFDRN
jgi:hypothetical protein